MIHATFHTSSTLRSLEEIKVGVDSAAREAADAAGELVERTARDRVRARTGRLRDSIKARSIRDPGSYGSTITPRGEPHLYSRKIEALQAYMAPALGTGEKSLPDAYTEAVEAVIQTAAR